MEQKVFYSKDFTGFWPVGTAAVVVAETAEEAKKILLEMLVIHGLPQKWNGFTVHEVDTTKQGCYLLNDGNY